jgi:hypothetical protein
MIEYGFKAEEVEAVWRKLVEVKDFGGDGK